MLSENQNCFTKDNLNQYLNELGKAYKKLNGKSVPVEIVLIGGAAIVANYGFRDMTTDIDAMMSNMSAMKEAANLVADKFNLPNGWINADFMKTSSYSSKLAQHSKFYRTFANVLKIYTISAEYLIA